MTEVQRIELARLSRERRTTCVMIDDLLILYLCTLPAPRLPHMFDCTLPFTFLEPYITTAGIVPTEVFYGRRREREQILAPMGSCFIYGGRQLGKTALLRAIEREYHDPSKGRIVLWLDLKAQGIGNERPIDGIWSLIARELRKQGVVPENVPGHVGPEKLLDHIRTWLDTDMHRRVLLLLDEADRFLASDGQADKTSESGSREAFRRAALLKGLMDRTNRRFKVVFAGLHNVKRTTRQSNHPLAHYGDPICIGPLLENGEWREARALIERPLASLGYRFASPDLVTRILSQTNYYPSLIQIYCKQLIDQLNDPHAGFAGPPLVIASRHIEDVYQSLSLRDEIKQRFNWTIQLDQRYEVIAYVVAYGSLSDDSHGLIEGFPVSWIREQALTWWRNGFRESTTEDLFLALLDEMVGLGILRVVREGYYTLRSPNVVLLMGTRDQIETELLRDREPPIEYERETFRAALRDESKPTRVDSSRRSPLTALQESELTARANGISIICGSLTAGRDELSTFLNLAVGSEYFSLQRFCKDRAEFERMLEDILKKRANDGTTIILVPPSCPWSDTWLEDTDDRLTRLVSNTSWARVAFVADPTTAWRLLSQDSSHNADYLHQAATTITLHPWHDSAVRQWLDDCGFGPTDQRMRQRILDVTGNWPFLLRKFYTETKADLRYSDQALDAIQEMLKTPEMCADLRQKFELSPSVPLKVLQTMVEWVGNDPIPVEDLIGIMNDIPGEQIRLCLRWADLFSFARPAGNDQWIVDPIVAQAVADARK